MVVHLKPETGVLIAQRVRQGGAYESVEAFVEQAVAMLHEHETWLAANRTEIAQGLADMKAGRGTPLSDFEKEFRKKHGQP